MSNRRGASQAISLSLTQQDCELDDVKASADLEIVADEEAAEGAGNSRRSIALTLRVAAQGSAPQGDHTGRQKQRAEFETGWNACLDLVLSGLP
jgi:hypothetical protein